jgi:hypothetical protein
MTRPYSRDFSQTATLEVNVSTRATNRKAPTTKKKKSTGRAAKLKSSNWYQRAVRSIGITNDKSPESGDDIFE